MKSKVDLSGTAFGDVDRIGDAASVISYLDEARNQFRAAKDAAHSLLRLRSNESVLDVGCGLGDDVREFATMVSPGGSAVGVDKSKWMIAKARRRADRCGLAAQFQVSQAEHLPWQSDYFDACHADRLLQHLPDPEAALNEMIRVLKPVGRLVVVDRDWGMVALESADPETTMTVLDRASAGIRNGCIGRRLHGLFRTAGLTELLVQTHRVNITRFKIADALLDLRIVAEHAISAEHIARQVGDVWLDDLLQRDRLGTFFATVTLFVAFGRKP